MFSYDVKFLTHEECVYLNNSDLKSLKYETKKKAEETVYDTFKRNYVERRGGYWGSNIPRQLRQLESKLHDTNIVYSEWTTDNLITLFFSSGIIAYITVKPNTLDITNILFDRYCVGKLSGPTVTGVAFCKSLLLLTHTEKAATLITFGKYVNNQKPCPISERDPYLQSIELGGSARRTERHISWCESTSHVRILVWGASVAEPAPWSPLPEDHANLHLYETNGQQLTLLAYHQLDSEVLLAELSDHDDNILHIVDQTACNKSGVTLSWLRYAVRGGAAVRLRALSPAASRARLAAAARAAVRSPCGARLLAACLDATLLLLHHAAGVTHRLRAGFIATDVRWAGQLIIATEEAGRIQCFDRALSLLHHHTKCVDLTAYMRETKRVQILATRSLRGGPLILASFNGGPLTLLKITHAPLLTAYIRLNRTSNAVALLRALDWEEEGAECLNSMSEIVRSALRKGNLGENGEVGVQMALGAYLAPTVPLPLTASKYAPAVHDLARKFFHHLLRRGRIEKALSLAVDLAAWDLFVDARCAAKRYGLQHLVEEASTCAIHYAKLDRPDSECSDSCSQCSSNSYTGSEDESSASSKAIKAKPPPLPRVPLPLHPLPTLPPQPSILTVPITQNEPYTTSSIRPNLHQYLERDTTIWGKNIKDDLYITNTYAHDTKPMSSNSVRWNSMDNVLNIQRNPNSSSSYVKSGQSVDLLRSHDERIASHFKHLFQTELKEEGKLNDRYNTQSNSNFNDRYPQENIWTVPGNKPEKNKVKFSDTVTIAVVSEPPLPDPARELAASLPLCPPHKYLSAFAPSENAVQTPPKIKVVHFGMV